MQLQEKPDDYTTTQRLSWKLHLANKRKAIIKSTWTVNLMSGFKNTPGPINLNSAISACACNIGIGPGIRNQI